MTITTITKDILCYKGYNNNNKIFNLKNQVRINQN